MRFQSFATISLLFAAVAFAIPSDPSIALADLATPALTSVNLRIEGSARTIFEGPILTYGHDVTTALGGTHHCDGTNNNANPLPGPTCTSALDNGDQEAHFGFDGPYLTAFDDFFITSIGGETETATQFWGLLRNFQFTPTSGCQQEVTTNDDILWAFDAFNKAHILKLSGPTTALKHKPVVFTVTDGSTGIPVAGADVDGQTTDGQGKVSLTFTRIGVIALKAQKSDSIRSNRLDVLVV